MLVSTHSRPKAAGGNGRLLFPNSKSFNTQPPEGGWMAAVWGMKLLWQFQHTAARRRLGPMSPVSGERCSFNTQPPEGGWPSLRSQLLQSRSFNTQPPEGGWIVCSCCLSCKACFNTQPPEGGWHNAAGSSVHHDSFNTQPPEGGWGDRFFNSVTIRVSTHSRPKAAGLFV